MSKVAAFLLLLAFPTPGLPDEAGAGPCRLNGPAERSRIEAIEVGVARGDLRSAAAAARELQALCPAEPAPSIVLAHVLLRVGLGEPSRFEARHAVETAPESVAAWSALAFVLEHDPIGRRHFPGSDRAGAVAAWQQARKLDPLDVDAGLALAELLQRGADGAMFGEGAEVGAAITVYQELRRTTGDRRIDAPLAQALAFAGRYEELVAFTEGDVDPGVRAEWRLTALAGARGARVVIAELAALSREDPEAARWAEEALALHLSGLGLFDQLATIGDWTVAEAGSPLLADSARVALRAREASAIKASPDDPVSIFREFHRSLHSRREMDDFSARWWSRRTYDATANAGREAFERRLIALAEGKNPRLVDMRPSLFLWFCEASATYEVEGSEAIGFRVAWSNYGVQDVGYLVPEQGELRVLALTKSPDRMAEQALWALGRDDLAAARQWLDWAWEDLTGSEREPGEESSLAACADADPVFCDPFLRLWPCIEGCPVEEVRAAAAALFTTPKLAKRAAPILEEALERTQDPLRRTALLMALRDAYYSLGEDERTVEFARRILALHPTSPAARLQACVATIEAGDAGGPARRAERELAEHPGDVVARRCLVQALSFAGDGPGSVREARKLIAAVASRDEASGVESSATLGPELNNAAWALLASGGDPADALILLNAATELGGELSGAARHTRAVALAEAGQLVEARDTTWDYLDAVGLVDPDPDAWYVFGRIAEQLDCPESARAIYRRAVAGPESEFPRDSAGTLARRRLAALDGRKATAAPGGGDPGAPSTGPSPEDDDSGPPR